LLKKSPEPQATHGMWDSIESIPYEMQKTLLQYFEKMSIFQEKSNKYIGKIIPSPIGIQRLAAYRDNAILLKGYIASMEQHNQSH